MPFSDSGSSSSRKKEQFAIKPPAVPQRRLFYRKRRRLHDFFNVIQMIFFPFYFYALLTIPWHFLVAQTELGTKENCTHHHTQCMQGMSFLTVSFPFQTIICYTRVLHKDEICVIYKVFSVYCFTEF